MFVSRKLLEKYVDLNNLTDEEISNRLTFAGIEVEEYIALNNKPTNLVIGEVLTSEKVVDAKNLSFCTVQINEAGEKLNIICGAPNVKAGQKVVVAKVGATLGDFKIKEALIRGHESNGMICSLSELGVPNFLQSESDKEGITVLSKDAPLGHEEVIRYLNLDDTLFNVKPLPNRSDAYSVINLARELSALFERPFNDHRAEVKRDFKTNLKLNVTASETPMFSLTELKNVQVTESPKWLRDILVKHEMRPINSVVDIANYVMLLTGRPLHMYDLDKVKSKSFIVRDDLKQTFVGLDEEEYTVLPGDQVITVKDEVACLGGVLGSLSSAVTFSSTNIALEVAAFSHAAIRKTSTRLNLMSDASLRFSRGINFYATSDAVNLALTLIKELNENALVSDTVTVTLSEPEERTIIYDPNEINRLLGTKFSDKEIRETLALLNIFVSENSVVKYPSYRLDLFTNADLAEEVIRLKGFSYIDEKLPALRASVGALTPYQAKRRELRYYLRNTGLYEVLTYTLISSDELATFKTLHHHEPLKLLHPMTPIHEYMRTHLLPSLLSAVTYNTSRQNNDFALFEISEITAAKYHAEHLAIALVGSKKMHDELKKEKYDFYDIKGYAESILSLFGIKSERVKYVENSSYAEFHPYQTADIMFQNTKIGVLGMLHPNVLKDQNITSNVLMMELNLSVLLNAKVSQSKMNEIYKYPSVTRDIAIVVPIHLTAEQIIVTLKKSAGKLVQEIVIFDIYQSDLLGQNLKSVALAIKLQASDRTLREEEINEVIAKISETAAAKLGAKLRG